MIRRNFLKLLSSGLAALFIPRHKINDAELKEWNERYNTIYFHENWGESINYCGGYWQNGYYVKNNIYLDKTKSIIIQKNWHNFDGEWVIKDI